jgi:predicted peptidase
MAMLGGAAHAAAPPEITPGKVAKLTFAAEGKEVRYFLFVPKNLTAPASTPLLVLFHGSGRNGLTLIDPWKKLAEKEGIVLLAPDSQDPRGWDVPLDGPLAVCSLVDEVKRALPVIDPRRVYLFGHSAGAVFVLYMAMQESEYFAAGALHAGAFRVAGDFDHLNLATRQIPLAITVGDRDAFFGLKDVNATVDGLKKAFIPVTLEVIRNHDHNYYVMSDTVNAWAWAALKDHRLEDDPKYIPRVFKDPELRGKPRAVDSRTSGRAPSRRRTTDGTRAR